MSPSPPPRLYVGEWMVFPIGTGLEPDSAPKYKKEWRRYLDFCQGAGIRRVPGRDRDWRFRTLSGFIYLRARTNKVRSIRGILSKIKHCGLCYDWLLPTAKGESPARLRIQISLLLRSIGKEQARQCKLAGTSTEPKRSLAMGRVAISLLFSAYGADTREGFLALPMATRQWLVVCVCMHSGCMRFKLVRVLQGTQSLRWSAAELCYRMASDWRKMKRGGAYTIPFWAHPKFDAMKYSGLNPDGSVRGSFTAADVLYWLTGPQMSVPIFSPEDNEEISATAFKEWLRQSFRRLLRCGATELAALLLAMTPHSWRAGLASDLARANVRPNVICKAGRWSSKRAMQQYVRDSLAQRLSSYAYNPIVERAISRARPRDGREAAHSSDGYDSSCDQEISERERQDSSDGYDDSDG